jgi:hypothetical protein
MLKLLGLNGALLFAATHPHFRITANGASAPT